jgi:thiol-disulfide isomerase/thioredoxin
MVRTLLIVIIVGIISCSKQENPTERLKKQYLATLITNGGENNFPIYIEKDGKELSAYVVNGVDTARFTSVKEISPDSIQLSFEHYDSHIYAKVDHNGNLHGRWEKRLAGGVYEPVLFSAKPSQTDKRYPNHNKLSILDGEWSVIFTKEDGSFYPAIGIFSASDAQLNGTFLTETGDYRFLEGVLRADSTFILSDFDGGHAFRFSGKLLQNGSISGDFYSRKTYHETFTGIRQSQNLQDPFKIAKILKPDESVSIKFPDVDGKIVSIDEEPYKNKPLIVYLFGSWCPNCADLSKMLKALYENTYQNSDLQILALAFEYTGEFSSDAEMVKRYKSRFNLPWDALVAGTSDKEAASDLLPFIEKVTSFPTTFFLNKQHKIEAVHVGFRGPGTGAYHELEKQAFINQINALLHHETN